MHRHVGDARDEHLGRLQQRAHRQAGGGIPAIHHDDDLKRQEDGVEQTGSELGHRAHGLPSFRGVA